ncbi:MAG TPA: hypothetical protein VF681_07850 [Abditibacteriaceae bacterium]|jgi:hypothetical protein
MATLIKYLLSLAVHAAWARAGKGGAAPPVRLPRGKGPVNLPVIGPWQMMAITWLVRKLWQRYGDDVKSRVGKVDHPAARQIHDWIPSTRNAASNGPAPQANSGTAAQPPANFTASASASTPTAQPNFGTRRLPHQVPASPAPSTGQPTSLLSRLRKGF